MKKKIGSSKSIKKYPQGGDVDPSKQPKQPGESTYSRFVGPKEPAYPVSPTREKRKAESPTTYKKGGSVGKPKMKMGGSCGTPKSLRKSK